MLPNDRMDPLFEATVQATEEAIVNALVAAETMTGVDGHTVIALPHDRLREVLKKYNRLVGRSSPAPLSVSLPWSLRRDVPGRLRRPSGLTGHEVLWSGLDPVTRTPTDSILFRPED